jgi:prepilin-type N-terminal cleavage/methylation domain-containing protein
VAIHSDTTDMIRSRIRSFAALVQRRLEGEEGFTLVELMIVLIVMGILLTVAVPSYLSFKDKGARTAASQDVSQAFRAVQSYNADNYLGSKNDPDGNPNNTGFLGLSLGALSTKYDASIDPNVSTSPFVVNPVGFTATASDFCLTATVGRWVAAQRGPTGAVTLGTNFTPGICKAT